MLLHAGENAGLLREGTMYEVDSMSNVQRMASNAGVLVPNPSFPGIMFTAAAASLRHVTCGTREIINIR